MGRTNFEKLEVYQLAEKIADKIWEIVIKWDRFAKNTVGRQLDQIDALKPVLDELHQD